MEIDLKNILNKSELTRKDKVLIILSHNNFTEKKVSEIKSIGKENGLREIEKWNISMVLSSLSKFAVKLKDGWIITNDGKDYLKELNFITVSPITTHHQKLVVESKKISSSYIRDFINESILSLEYGLLKSSVVFSWIGAISILYEHVNSNHILEFNIEAKRRFPKWKNARNIDGITRMKEYDFLQVIEGISIIGKNTKNELEQCLQLRNSCGHPSTLKIGESRVASHLEILILNVFKKFC